MTRRRDSAGFTLLELLVALMVLGLVLLGLVQGFRFGLTAWATQSSTIAARDEIGAAERLLRGLVERIEPGTEGEPPPLIGLPGALQFQSSLALAANPLPVHAVQAALGVDAEQRLRLRLLPNPRAQRLGPPQLIERTLVAGVARLEVAYWRPARSGHPGEWQRSWDAATPPGLIRLRLVFPPGDRRHWPDVLAAPLRDGIGR